MATFLDDISIYNAKAASAIALAVSEGDTPKANLMSSLKTTANDLTLSEAIRLNALTALINVGNLLDIPLPPYFPVAVTYADSVTYVGLHDNLSGLQGGAPGEYYHLTAAERSDILNKVSPSDLQFANLVDSPYDNALLSSALTGKQNALSGTGFVTISGTTISYDNSTYLTAVSGPAGGDLSGTYPNPTIASSVVMGKLMFGWNPSYPFGTGAISSSDSLLTAIQKLNASVNNIVTNPSGVSSVSLSMTPNTIFQSSTLPASGVVTLSATLLSQTANTFLAAPNGTNGVPSFRAIAVNDIPALSPDPSGTYGGGSPLEIPVITVDAQGRVTAVSLTAATGSGTVTSVNVDPPSFFTVGSPVTTAGDILMSWSNTISPNTVLAGPSTGSSAAAPIFRSLVEDDIPSLDPSKITGLSALLSTFLTGDLSDGKIWIGNTSNAATPRTLTGDVTVDNMGVTAIGLAKVQYDMIQDVTAQTLLGRYELTNGVVQQVTLSGDFVLDDMTGVLSLSSPVAPVVTTKGDLLSFTTTQDRLPSSNVDGDILMVYNTAPSGFGLQWNTVGGDIEVTDASTGEFTIKNNAVSLGKIQLIAANTILGNNTGGSLAPLELSVTDVTAMLNVFSTTGTDKGLVPGSNGAAATYYLDATGNWSIPGGGGGTTTFALTIGSGLSGTAATFNGSAAVTVSLNTGNANTWTALQTFRSNIYLGEVGGSAGNARFLGSTSGYVILQAPAAPANQTYTLPTAYPAASSGYYLTSTTGGTLSWVAVTSGITTNALTNGTGILSFSFDGGTAGITVGIDNTVVATLTDTQSLSNKTLGSGTVISVATPDKGTIWYSSDASGTVAPLTATGNGGKYLSINSGTGIPEWTGVSVSSVANLSGGTANQIPYQTGVSTTSFITAPTTASTFLQWNGSAFAWATAGGGSTSPGGATTEVQYNNAGAFGGIPELTYSGGFVQIQSPKIGTGGGNGHYHVRGATSTPGGIANYVTQFVNTSPKQIGYIFQTDAFESYILFGATADRTYTLPDATGTVVLDTFAQTLTNKTLTTPSITTPAITGIATFDNGVSAGEIRLKEPSGSGTDYIALKAQAVASPVVLTLPNSAGSSGQIIQTDGSGNLSWVNNTGGTFVSQYISTTTANTYSTTTLGVAFSILIPANTFGAGDVFQIRARLNKSGAGTSTLRTGFNTTNANLTGITYTTGTVSVSSSPNLGERTFSIDGTTTSYQSSALGFWGSGGSETQLAAISSTTAIDWTVNQYFIIAAQMASGDVFTQVFITIIPQN